MMDDKNCYLRVEKADTGQVILKYEERVKKNNSAYDGFTRVDRTEVFNTNEIQNIGPRIIEILSAQIEVPEEEGEEKSEGKEITVKY